MKNNKKETSKETIKSVFSCEKIVLRLISAILAFNISNTIHIGLSTTLSYGQNFSIATIAIVLLTVIGSLSFINWIFKDSETDFYACLILLLVCSKSWLAYDETHSALVVLLFLAVLFLFQFKKTKPNHNKKIKHLIPIIAIVSLVQLYIISKHGILRYKTFLAPNFDLGIPMQNFYYMAKTWIPYSTCERDFLLSHFAVHTSFIYYLVMPFYKLFMNGYTLPIVSGVLVVSGIIPTYLIAMNHKLKDYTKLLVCLTYLIYAPMICGTFYDFHENMFLLPLLLWVFYFYEKNNKIGFIISAILVLFVKEDAPLYMIIFGIYMYFDGHKKEGAITSILSTIYFVLGVSLLNKYGIGVMSERYGNLIYENSGMLGVIKTFIVNPSYFMKQLVSGKGKIEYYIQILLPFGFIPLISKDKKNYILLIPLLLTAMTTYIYGYDITHHYIYGGMAFLVYLFILNIKNIKSKNYLTVCFIGAILVNMACVVTPIYKTLQDYNTRKDYYAEKERVLQKIPKNATVSATGFLLPHLANRDIIYEVYYHENKTDIDYVVIETFSKENREFLKYYIDHNYKEFSKYEDIVILKKQK